jgi:transcriptional regulator with XRE-family HTH domain
VDGLGRGQRIARARRRRGLSQAALAGLVGRSESWLSQVERGLREVDSHTVLVALAEILRVEVTDLTGDSASDPHIPRYEAAREIERAMMAYDSLESVIDADSAVREPDLARLRLALDRANRSYQAARYDEAGRMLPALIRSVETADAYEPVSVSVISATWPGGPGGEVVPGAPTILQPILKLGGAVGLAGGDAA